MSIQVTMRMGEHKIEADLNRGVYFIKIKSSSEEVKAKIIITN